MLAGLGFGGNWQKIAVDVRVLLHNKREQPKLVGNSKVMAHALPNLVPPIYRHYTLRFLYKNETIINDTEWEWERLQAILQGFFYPVVESELFISQSMEWNDKQFPWDTSPLKIIDNLIIGWTAKGKESSLEIAPHGSHD
jgi:hypothetical protein